MRIATDALGKSIPIELNLQRAIEIDGTLVARALGLEPAAFKRLMDLQKITVMCERGTGDDIGLYRASYYYKGTRARLIIDTSGNLVDSQ
ncbi:MAG: DUF6522 family protein [Thermomonas sp.]